MNRLNPVLFILIIFISVGCSSRDRPEVHDDDFNSLAEKLERNGPHLEPGFR